MVGATSVTNTKILIVFSAVVELDALKALLLELLAEDDDGVVVEDTVEAGSLSMNGDLVPPSYVLVLKPGNGATDR